MKVKVRRRVGVRAYATRASCCRVVTCDATGVSIVVSMGVRTRECVESLGVLVKSQYHLLFLLPITPPPPLFLPRSCLHTKKGIVIWACRISIQMLHLRSVGNSSNVELHQQRILFVCVRESTAREPQRERESMRAR